MKSRTIEIEGEEIDLLPDRAAYWARERTLVTADLHLGKAAAFRRSGVPIPHGTTAEDLGRLSALVRGTGAQRLVILGDFLHSAAGRAEKTFLEADAWRRAHPRLDILVVRGNHDRHAGPPPASWNIRSVEEPHDAPPFFFSHDAIPAPGFVFHGHIHPKVEIRDGRSGRSRFPCFVLDDRRLAFPAFGTFTGGMTVELTPGRRCFVLIGDEVFCLPK